jgi:ABC-type dipeptide/oligopeptide/nickel transport system ATPase component
MRRGHVVEEGPCERVFNAPASSYTRTLLDAIPLPEVDPEWLWRTSENEDAA